MLDAAIADLVKRQHGVIARDQALELGLSAAQVRYRVRTDRWRRLGEGLYVVAGFPTSDRTALFAACLGPGQRAVVSHEAAAALHTLATFPPGPVVVTVRHASARLDGLATVHQSRRLFADHIVDVDGLPTTTVARTIVDLAARYRQPRLEVVVDDALARRSLLIGELMSTFDDLVSPGRKGLAIVRRVLAVRQPGYVAPSTASESKLLRALRRGGLPRPVLQFPHPGAEIVGFVDAAYPAQRLLVEVDGRRWHTRERDFARDRARDNAATAARYRTLRFTWDDVSRRPDWVADQVRAVMAVAA
jgi:very-short-patch-repair endonuclease